MAQGDAAGLVDAVVADPVVSEGAAAAGPAWMRAWNACSGVWPFRARWAVLVVVRAEGARGVCLTDRARAVGAGGYR